MSDKTPHDEDVRNPVDDTDTLIGRIIDREATTRDREQFEQMAAAETDLWRTLALRQLDMTMLSDRLIEHTDAADRIETRPWRRAPRLNLPLALSGWAAVLAVGLWWAVLGGDRGKAGARARARRTEIPRRGKSPAGGGSRRPPGAGQAGSRGRPRRPGS